MAPLQQVFRLASLNLGQWLIVLAVIRFADAGREGYKRRQHRDELAAWQPSELIGDAE